MPPARRLAFCLALALGLSACHDTHFESRSRPGQIELYDDLFALALPTPENAVAVGYRGAVYVTADGGATWADRSPDTDLLLYDVGMSDPRRGWAVGQLGLVLRTEDGGQNWAKQPTTKEEQGVHLFSLQVRDANTALAVGAWGTRLHTDDGGRSWQDESLVITTTHPQYVWLSPPEQERVRRGDKVFEDVTLNDVYCRPLPSQRCWIVGEFGYIFYSQDAGRNWERAQIVGTGKVDPVVFEYDGIEMGDEDTERIQAFVESILSQEHLNLQIEAFASPREIQDFGRGDDPTTLFDVLDARALSVRGVVEETGILSDRLRMRGTPPWDYEDFLADDPGFLERYLESQTAESPLVRVTVAQNPYLFRVRFADDQNGIITGLGGVVLTSDDGGVTWRYGQSGIKQALFAVAPRGPRAIAVGEKGLVRESQDGGRTWAGPSADTFPEVFTFMRDVVWADDGQVGMIAGQRGLVLRTEDGGRSWKKVLPPERDVEVASTH